ncbi:hypothetical protein GQ44DRAFT_727593 [Phaeosphaeriaceae sp. PMI808]|nr:hypothetical protein GQ44DRAFT_727593 [Phaeosphaeriaceae sp. PMI808]
MTTATYYAALGLLPSAAPEVIRASYKALALVYHPDKTLNFTAEERASHAAIFNEVQAAYDVLSMPSLKVAYDAELARHENRVDRECSTFHRQSSPCHSSETSSSMDKRRPTVKLTTPEEKALMRAKTRQSVEDFCEKRARRDEEDTKMDTADLKTMIQIWQALAEENKTDPAVQAHCTIRIFEYEQKIVEREQQHREWLTRMSTPATKQCKGTPESSKRSGRSPSTASTRATTSLSSHKNSLSSAATPPTPAKRDSRKDGIRKRVETERETTAAARACVRAAEKAQREAAKQAQKDEKAAAVCTEKKKQRARKELQTQKDAERVARARAKAHAAPQKAANSSVKDKTPAQTAEPVVGLTSPEGDQVNTKKTCCKCGVKHASFREWRMCNMQAAEEGQEDLRP